MERVISEYKILLAQGVSEEEINNEIAGHLSEGWEIYGQHQLSVNWDYVNGTDCITITQAVVKYRIQRP